MPIKTIYHQIEKSFEKLTFLATTILGNSIAFMVALSLVVFWLTREKFYTQEYYDSIGDAIHGTIFLSLFIIQKSFNHFSAALHLKINELLASHEPASNVVMNVENRTEIELAALTKEYREMADRAVDENEEN